MIVEFMFMCFYRFFFFFFFFCHPKKGNKKLRDKNFNGEGKCGKKKKGNNFGETTF